MSVEQAPTPIAVRQWRVRMSGSGLIGLALVGLFLMTAIFGPLLVQDSTAQNITQRFSAPSVQHLMGTDQLGRDLLARIVEGARTAAVVALPSVGGALIAGMLIGAFAGYLGGTVDQVILIGIDTFQAFPALILALALVALLGPSIVNLVIIIAVSMLPAYARIARAQVALAKSQPYVEAERVLGAGGTRILVRHIVPNIVGPIIVLAALDIGSAITIEAGLSFLGLGVQPPTASWGSILREGFSNIYRTPWPIIWASIALMMTTLGTTFLGEALQKRASGRGEADQ